MRQTSVQAYREVMQSGLVSKRRREAYRFLYHHGPMSGRQIDTAIQGYAAGGENSYKGYERRLSELREMNLVEEMGIIKCEYTGHDVILWDVTSNMPIEFKRPEPLRYYAVLFEGTFSFLPDKIFRCKKDAEGYAMKHCGEVKILQESKRKV